MKKPKNVKRKYNKLQNLQNIIFMMFKVQSRNKCEEPEKCDPFSR